ncbi:transposase [Streptomyces sp. 3330]|nr:transposase [Streptomyces sp. 3330]
MIDGILRRVRTGVQWRDPPEPFGPWKTVYERQRLWSADDTWERLLQQVQATADAAGEIDWDIAVDSTIVHAHQHAAGALTDPPPVPAPKGAVLAERQAETAWQCL